MVGGCRGHRQGRRLHLRESKHHRFPEACLGRDCGNLPQVRVTTISILLVIFVTLYITTNFAFPISNTANRVATTFLLEAQSLSQRTPHEQVESLERGLGTASPPVAL